MRRFVVATALVSASLVSISCRVASTPAPDQASAVMDDDSGMGCPFIQQGSTPALSPAPSVVIKSTSNASQFELIPTDEASFLVRFGSPNYTGTTKPQEIGPYSIVEMTQYMKAMNFKKYYGMPAFLSESSDVARSITPYRGFHRQDAWAVGVWALVGAVTLSSDARLLFSESANTARDRLIDSVALVIAGGSNATNEIFVSEQMFQNLQAAFSNAQAQCQK